MSDENGGGARGPRSDAASDSELVSELGRRYSERVAPLVKDAFKNALKNAIDDTNRGTISVIADLARSDAGKEIQRRAKAIDDAAGGIIQSGIKNVIAILSDKKR